MSFRDRLPGDNDPVLMEALKNFRASVHAWSEAASSRPRTVVRAGVRHGAWRLAASWALGCVLAAGSVAGGLYAHHHQQELATLAAAKAAQKAAQERAAERQAAAQKALQEQAALEDSSAASTSQADDDLLATVDSDVSREVPSAMEPLAQLMDDNGTTNKGTK